ncbi:NUDIX domain-containing protein [Streptococcus merionis]|uniref:NUDIX domain-containing protein n=1 Tax=Streptococcus merionis TaxID=400065 RepID=UPI0026F29863|nr:NUDIX domain-containing protein [Streptococcus merionis]
MTQTMREMTSIYLLHDRKILLLFRQGGRVVNNVWVAAAGGHLEPEELNHPYQGAIRELEEELGLTEDYLKEMALRYITLRSVNGEIRQNYFYFAQVRNADSLNLISNEGQLQWFDLDQINQLDMPLSARMILKHYIEIGCETSALYGGLVHGDYATWAVIEEK